MIQEKDIEFFNNNGYLIIDNLIPKSELKKFEQAVKAVVSFQLKKQNVNVNKGRNLSDGMNLLEEINHDIIADISDYLAYMPESLRILSSSKIKHVINLLLKQNMNDPLYITNTAPILAMPNDIDYKYAFHKDTFYTIPKSDYIQIWAPLVRDASKKNGTLQILPGSHKAGWKGQKKLKGVSNRHKYVVTDKEISKYKIKHCSMNLGQIMFFHPGLAHQSGTNSSDETRFSLVSVYHNIKNNNIRPLYPNFKFKGSSPEEFYDELNGRNK